MLAGGEFQRINVALPFGVRILAKHHHSDIGFRYIFALRGISDIATSGRHGLLKSLQNTGRAHVVSLLRAGTLPGNRPTAALLGQIIRTIARHQYVGIASNR